METLEYARQHRPLWQRLLLWRVNRPQRWLRYLLLLLLCLGLIWAASLSYILLTPRSYTSAWTLILPGTGAGANVNLSGVGQIASSSSSAYGSHDLSPKVNYQHIALSPRVLGSTAESLKLTMAELGKPKIKLIPQTSLLLFKISASTPEFAQQKAQAFHSAFQQQLEQLRKEELHLRDHAVKQMLAQFNQRLNLSRQALADFQSRHYLISEQQSSDLARTLLDLQKQQADIQIRQAAAEARLHTLMKQLHLNPSQVADALLLRNDPLYTRYQQQYAKAQVEYRQAQAKWGAQHPQLKSAQKVAQASWQGLLQQARQLIGKVNKKQLTALALQENSVRAQLYQQMIETDVDSKALAAQNQYLTQQIKDFRQQLSDTARQTAELTRLKRAHQIDSAAFSSALARIDAGKSDTHASYPLIQILDPPNLPDRPSAPKKKFALLGAIVGSLFVLIGMFLLWVRTPVIHFLIDQ
ncbi:GumC family protein [Candidatus Venteria ishoeyi]|uniref:Chain length determinant protein n=1 Tax=Candidatus Venteria ishoeyi TaxID=1899563 RepID=A0A1H6FD78_9GAMM|nr:hypothetical protein [Candidatus Venteria ishoeyi]MDM8546542.1 hypothetical protein [Candidatus Venteria ishoeyi]SEH07116.1 Uncharacterised protein [Candidatus Venteria ishoeyi]